MRLRRLLAAFALALLPGFVLATVFFVTTVWASSYATLTVDTLADGAGDCNTSGSCTLRAAIAAAASGDTITFAPALAGGTITLTGGELTIDKSLTISGSNAITVSGGGTTRVFDVAAGVVTLDGVSVTAGNVAGDVGGGLRVRSGAEVTLLNNAWFSNTAITLGSFLNPSGGLGGAIHNAGVLTIVDSRLFYNAAEGVFDVGGGHGGAIYNTGTLTVINTTIRENGSINNNGAGGGLDNLGTTTILTSTFTGNHSCGGGAIFNRQTGSLTLSGSTLVSNTVQGCSGGGGVLNAGALTISNSTLTGNSGSAGGGAIRNLGGANLTVANSTLMYNYSFGGGGIDNEATLTLRGVIIAKSTGGGDCSVNSAGATPTASNTLIEATGNSACDLTNGVDGNIIGSDPLLGALADNGGPTLTHLPQSGSPAIDAGDCSAGPAADQRGVARPQDDTCDIGAVEVAAQPALTVVRSGAGAGSVVSTPAGIACGLTCTASFDAGTVVTLTAAAASGSVFSGWSGACNGSSACTVTMTAAQVVTATFDVYVPPKQPAQAQTMCYGADIQVSIEPIAPAAATPGFDLVVINGDAPVGLYLTGDVQCVPYTGFASMIELGNQLVVAGCANGEACNTISRIIFGSDGGYRIDTIQEVQEVYSQFLPLIDNECTLDSIC